MKNLLWLPLLALSLSAHADEREWLPYKKVIEQMRLDKFYAIPPAERDKLALFVTITPTNKAIKPGDVQLTLVDGAERHALALSTPDYRIALVPNPKWLADDARIMTNLPKGEKSAMAWDLLTTLPEGLQWNYATIMAGVPQSNNAIKKMAGAMSMFAPTIKVLVLRFDKPAQLTIAGKLYNSDAKHEIRLKTDSALMKDNPLVVASERPFEADLDTE
ncbi:hypothetical protein [Rugamonas sp.]|uniref:hypothetical protein n=1 Tax=Rugamonas sp. TaxID=1926287 RepID=UPI0025DB6CD1|nr:hypothetical protein [Rugamonas sp.]